MAIRQATEYTTNRGSRIVTRPSIECVTLQELKTHLRIPVETDEEDLYLGNLIIEASTFIEDQINVALITQTWRVTYDSWPGYREPWWDGVRDMPVTELYSASRALPITIPRWPLISIDSVTVYDENSVSTAVVVADVFDVDAVSTPGRMKLKRGATWPIATRSLNAVDIQYQAGYGTVPENVPPTLRRAVLENAAYLYTHRGDCTPEQAYARSGARQIVDMYRKRSV